MGENLCHKSIYNRAYVLHSSEHDKEICVYVFIMCLVILLAYVKERVSLPL